jgi:hypothetical protein
MGLFHLGHLVTAEVVENDDIFGPQSWAQKLAHIGKKHLAIHGPVSDERRGQLLVAQGGYEGGGFPMAVRSRTDALSLEV